MKGSSLNVGFKHHIHTDIIAIVMSLLYCISHCATGLNFTLGLLHGKKLCKHRIGKGCKIRKRTLKKFRSGSFPLQQQKGMYNIPAWIQWVEDKSIVDFGIFTGFVHIKKRGISKQQIKMKCYSEMILSSFNLVSSVWSSVFLSYLMLLIIIILLWFWYGTLEHLLCVLITVFGIIYIYNLSTERISAKSA